MSEAIQKLPDGDYSLGVVYKSMNNDFKNESDLCDYIERNIKLFCSDCLGIEYKSHSRECPATGENSRRKGQKRIDFLITAINGDKIGVECKCPQYLDVSYAIGQALTYLTIFERFNNPISRMIIVSTKIDTHLPFVIDKFSLPIEFIAFDKSKFLTFKNGSTNGK